MRSFRIAIDIAAPAERLWQVMSDTDRWHEWTPSVTSVKRLGGGGPFAVGSRAGIRQPRFPPALWKITAIEPGRSFTRISGAPSLRVVAAAPRIRGGRNLLNDDYLASQDVRAVAGPGRSAAMSVAFACRFAEMSGTTRSSPTLLAADGANDALNRRNRRLAASRNLTGAAYGALPQ